MPATPETETAPSLASDPNEMTGRFALTLRNDRSLVVTARVTPAGLRAVGVLVSMILVSTAVVVRAAKQRG